MQVFRGIDIAKYFSLFDCNETILVFWCPFSQFRKIIGHVLVYSSIVYPSILDTVHGLTQEKGVVT